MRNLFIVFAGLLTLLLQNLSVSAQPAERPITWKFSIEAGKEAGTYLIHAKAVIGKGWHVFAPDPGGDGLLIPTAMVPASGQKYTVKGPLKAEGKKIDHEMEGMGIVHYYENEVDLILPVGNVKPGELKGILTYQLCNDIMCLPPEDLPFTVSLN